MLTLVIGAAFGEDGDFTYAGVISAGADFTDTIGVHPIEAEVDLEAYTGILFARADLDVHIGAARPGLPLSR